MNKSEKILESGSFLQLLLNLSLPSVIVILIMIVYNIADTYFIGQTGDPTKIVAISLSMPVFAILSGIGTLFGNGGTTSASISLGEKNTDKIKSISTFCLTGSLGTGLVFFIVLFVFSEQFALLLGADAETLEATVTYLRTFSFASPFVLFSTAYGSMLRADGDGSLAVIPNLTGTLSNILLDAVFILVLHLDVFGAALATVLGNVLSSLLIVILVKKKKDFLLPDFHSRPFQTDIMIPVLTLGLPMTISTLLNSVASTIQNRMMMSYGSTALAAQSVAGKVGMIITMLLMGFCMGMQPALSYNYGSKNYKRMYQIIRQTGIFTFFLGLVLTTVTSVYKDAIIATFIDNTEVIAMGHVFVIASVLIGPFYGFYQLAQTFMQATGKVNYAIFSSMLDKFLLLLPVLFFMNLKFGVYGIAFSNAVTLMFSLTITLFLAFRWSRQLTRPLSP